MIFRIPEEKEFRLVVEGLYNELTNQTLPFFLEIDCKVLDRCSLSNLYPYFDYSVSFKVVGRTEHFIQMSLDHYDPLENIWLFYYGNVLQSEIGSSDAVYDLFVQISWIEERDESNQYVPFSVVYVWVEFQDSGGDSGMFL